jgi:very-short-patch-repair endonuclease
VDGPHHVRAAQDHERDRLFRAYGIYVERFTAEECYQDAPAVVRKFLTLLARNS